MPNEDRPDSRPAGSHPPAHRPAGAVAPPDGRTRYANGERRRAAIVDEAMTVFATRGFHNLSMRQIAEAVGVSHTLLRHHFGTKDAILQAVLARREETEAGWRAALVAERGLLDALPLIMEHNAAIPGLIQLDAVLRAEAVNPDHPAHDYAVGLSRRFRSRLRADLDASHAEDEQQDVPMIPPLQSTPKEDPHTSSRASLQQAKEAYLLHQPLETRERHLKESLGSGRRLYSDQPSQRGRLGRVRPYSTQCPQLSLPATIRAAIPYQYLRQRHLKDPTMKLCIHPEDYRSRRLHHRGGYHILFVLDVSGSMGVRERMSLVKGTIIELLKEAYAKRDKVGLITFAQDEAELRLPFTHSAERAAHLMQDIRTGGRTPLWLAIERAGEYLDAERRRVAECLPVVLLLTDGRATSAQRSENHAMRIAEAAKMLQRRCYRCLIIDTESGFIRLKQARHLAELLQAEYYHLDELAQLRRLLHPR